MNNQTKNIIIGVIVVVVILLIGYKVSNKSATEGEPIKIGFIGALTGVGAAIGEDEMNGALLAVDVINESGGVDGRMLELVPEDVSLDKMRVAGSVASKLINVDKVIAIVGPQWDEPALAILPIIEDAQVPTVSPDVTQDLESQKDFEYFFSTWYDNGVGIDVLLDFAKEKSWNRVAIIRPVGGGFYQYTRNLFVERAASRGIEIVEDIDVGNPLTTDYRTHLTKIKPSNPDAIFIVLGDPTQCPFLNQAIELGLNVPILSTESSGTQAVLENCPKALENLYFATPKLSTRYLDFEKAFIEKFGKKPSVPMTVNSYDAVAVIADALERTNLEGGEKLRNAISKTKDYNGYSLGAINFDEKGFVITPDDAFEMHTVREGEYIIAE